MRHRLIFLLAAAAAFCASAQTFSLDSCRAMAVRSNKQLMMSRQRITGAEYQKKEAFAAYLPGIDFAGGYAYNQKNISIFDSDQMLPTKTFNPLTQQYEFNIAKNPLTGEPIKNPANGQPVPETVALIPKEAMEFNIHNVFFGAVTLTQPIFMGGKIIALNKMARQAKDLAQTMHQDEEQNVVYAVDAAYWMVVSLKAKHKLAESYVSLLDTLDHNVGLMLEQGVATRSDKLSVDVKLNSARVDLTRVENGLALARMALAQVCGLPVDTQMALEDEDRDLEHGDFLPASPTFDMGQVYERRHDLEALRIGQGIARQKANLALSTMLPNVALVGAYSFSNPNMFDGFKRRFNGAFSVGAMVTIPIWHWGGNYYKYKAARNDEFIMELRLQDAEELVTLQVNQAAFRMDESIKTFAMTKENLASADENLRSATLGFKEGVATADNVMAAQTAWLKANSENIDAMIDMRLCRTYLDKTLGLDIY